VHGKLVEAKEGLYMGEENAANDPRMGLPTFGSNVFLMEIPEMKPLFTRYDAE
jgi:hypothetical protein